MPDKISSIVYLDALLPEDGIAEGIQALFDSGVYVLAPDPFAPLKFGKDDISSRLTAQPLATFLELISLTGAYQEISKKTYIWASQSQINEATKNFVLIFC